MSSASKSPPKMSNILIIYLYLANMKGLKVSYLPRSCLFLVEYLFGISGPALIPKRAWT